MTKVAIKNVNITSFGRINILRTFSQSWALKNLPNLYWANVEVAAKHSVMEVFFVVFHTSPLVWVGGACLEKTQETPKHLISTYRTPKRHLNI